MPLCLPPAWTVHEQIIARRSKQEGPDEITAQPVSRQMARNGAAVLRPRPTARAPTEQPSAGEADNHGGARGQLVVQRAFELANAFLERQARLLRLTLFQTYA